LGALEPAADQRSLRVQGRAPRPPWRMGDLGMGGRPLRPGAVAGN